MTTAEQPPAGGPAPEGPASGGGAASDASQSAGQPAGGAPALALEAAREILASQPFSRLLGATLTGFRPGDAVLELRIRDQLRQQDGYLHGGVLAYAADTALSFAAGSKLGPAILTSGMTVTYLRPAQGRTLRAHAQVVHTGARQVVARCDLYAVGEDGQALLCAVAQGTAMTTRSR